VDEVLSAGMVGKRELVDFHPGESLRKAVRVEGNRLEREMVAQRTDPDDLREDVADARPDVDAVAVRREDRSQEDMQIVEPVAAHAGGGFPHTQLHCAGVAAEGTDCHARTHARQAVLSGAEHSWSRTAQARDRARQVQAAGATSFRERN
jgi:hypothetical protein